ncbi:MAG: HlyD family secretion protein [Campylobacterota bacterium]|nr:HlyD family secretion protein [Campylobacterota bacterium]
MTRLFTLLFLPLLILQAKEYYAKIEPYEIRTISSNVSGLILFTDEQKEGAKLGSKEYIVIDDELDVIERDKLIKKIELLHVTLKLNKELKKNYDEIATRKGENYKRIKDLKIKSSVEKDREFYDVIASQNSLISIEKEIVNLQTQINDLELRAAQLKRSIADKHLSAEGYTLYSLMVKPGQVVAPSTPLAKIADTSRALLTVYLSAEEIRNVKSKILYLDGKKSTYKIDRIWNIADEQHLSSYKVQIIIDAPQHFSSLMKVELRDE